MNNQYRNRGFTLIEVMIVVAIIAILAAIALPSYREQVARGRRADAKAALLEASQWMERQYTVSRNYAKKGDGSNLDSAALASAPLLANGSTATNYTLSFATAAAASAPSVNAYSLRMLPTGPMNGDRCGAFTITNTGVKAAAGGTLAECWDR